jgi:hypothetical protein
MAGVRRYRRDVVTAVLWPTVCEVVRAAHGFICSHCISSALALPGAVVAMATLGVSRLDGFEMAEAKCARCGMRGRAIRARQVPLGDTPT